MSRKTYHFKAFVSLLVVFCSLAGANSSAAKNTNEADAIAFLEEYDKKAAHLSNLHVLAYYNHQVNMTHYNAEKKGETAMKLSDYESAAHDIASSFDPTNFSEDTKRQLHRVGMKYLSNDEMKHYYHLMSEMGKSYSQAKLCRVKEEKEECMQLEPELTKLMADSRNASERLWAWQNWRVKVSRKIKPTYLEFLDMQNKISLVNDFKDFGHELRERYEVPDFETDVANLWIELRPLYLELHAYIRRKLYETYGPEVVDLKGTLPQHILGDMWGRFWVNLYKIATPYPNGTVIDPTENMKKQNYTVRKMYELADEFFTSMGLYPVPDTFYNLSVLEKPKDRDIHCHPTAWDFRDRVDFRVKMCTVITFFDLKIVHHELGHIQYYRQYAHLPMVYRTGANDGFHEAVGEVMSMVVSTPRHLNSIGLIDNLQMDHDTAINYLLQLALQTIASIPFHYLHDKFRWKAWRKDYPDQATWNDEFWKMSEEIVGVHAPVERTPEDLDIASLYHVIIGIDLIRYFTRTILQFQFFESLCQIVGHKGPMHECDFYQSKEAGAKLAAMLAMGHSKPWPEALEKLTGEKQMSTRAIREYFAPLEQWLKETNQKNGDTPGWTHRGIQTKP